LAKRGYLPARSRFGEGRGEIFRRYVFSIMDSLVTLSLSPANRGEFVRIDLKKEVKNELLGS
jgi:hypothetical protein